MSEQFKQRVKDEQSNAGMPVNECPFCSNTYPDCCECENVYMQGKVDLARRLRARVKGANGPKELAQRHQAIRDVLRYIEEEEQ